MGTLDLAQNLIWPSNNDDQFDSMMKNQHTMYTLNVTILRWKYRLLMALCTVVGAAGAAAVDLGIEVFTDYNGILNAIFGWG
jgi:hypothetical protein